jgi:iduronate 2-sulfatase
MKPILNKLALTALAGFSIYGVTAQQKKMNVLFIAIDDFKPELGCYGNKIIKTPNIDKLAQNGTVFLNNYCQQSVSGPTRASLMTGKRPDYTGIYNMSTLMRDVNPTILTLPQYFISQGFETAGIGKIYDPRCVDKDIDLPSWSIPFYKESKEYFPTALGEPALGQYQLPETKALILKLTAEAKDKGMKGKELREYVQNTVKPSMENADVPDNAYEDGANTLHAEAIMAQLAKGNKPFFLAVGIHKPHLPFTAPKKYWDLYKREEMPVAAFQKHALNSPEYAYTNSGELRAFSDIPALTTFSDQTMDIGLPIYKQQELIHGYYACASYSDALVGQLLHSLDSIGLRDNTIIVLWGDHGWHLGDHDLWTKHTDFEQATHAPLIISVPNMKGNKTLSMSEFVDIFPTLCDLTGIPTPKNLDGESLMPVMKNPEMKVKKYSISQYPRSQKSTKLKELGYADGKVMGYSLRTNRYRITMWITNNLRDNKPFDESAVTATELYDYQKDPLETINVYNSKEYVAVAKEMKANMLEFFKAQQMK